MGFVIFETFEHAEGIFSKGFKNRLKKYQDLIINSENYGKNNSIK